MDSITTKQQQFPRPFLLLISVRDARQVTTNRTKRIFERLKSSSRFHPPIIFKLTTSFRGSRGVVRQHGAEVEAAVAKAGERREGSCVSVSICG